MNVRKQKTQSMMETQNYATTQISYTFKII